MVGTDRTTRERRRLQQDRHLPEGARGRATTACRSTSRLPSPPSIDWTVEAGADIPIEERSGDELTRLSGPGASGEIGTVRVTGWAPAANPAFDVTPARLMTAYITERGVLDRI